MHKKNPWLESYQVRHTQLVIYLYDFDGQFTVGIDVAVVSERRQLLWRRRLKSQFWIQRSILNDAGIAIIIINLH